MSDREANTLQYHLYAESKKKGKKKENIYSRKGTDSQSGGKKK